ncbi:MAG TPA: hypothetical protein VLT91_03550, partial [Rhizomicrobium sp.]|nr:hypothetical protein [Rhizomicrobium sp.]
NYISHNTLDNNNNGIGLYVAGTGAKQHSFVGSNEIENNGFFGVYGQANSGAYQLVSIFTLGNTVTGNGANYLFGTSGGATNNIY